MDIVQQVAKAIDEIPGQPTTREIARIAIEEYQEALWLPVFGALASNYTIPPPALRHHRAQAITARIMQIIGNYLRHDGDLDGSEASRDLYRTFYETGAEVVTDADRTAAGLPMRGPHGLTLEELRIMELKRMEVMLRPMQPIVMNQELDALTPRSK